MLKAEVASRRFGGAAVCFSGLAAIAFLIVRPPVGDFWAAQARQYAALHGVGLHYWFAWFGGTVPGHYSVFAPYLLRVVNPGVLGAAATVASVLLCRRLLASSGHPVAAAWVAAVVGSFSLWSGRIPFAAGTALMLAGLVAVSANRRGPAAVAGAAAALVSPVSGAFLILGVLGALLHDRERRVTASWAAGGAAVCLIGVAAYFGLPGSEGFPVSHALLAAGTCALLLLARPPAFIRTVVIISVLACPVLAIVPNGMGTNFERFAWICLPVAVVATGRAIRPIVYLTSVVAALAGVAGSAHDLYVAAQPMSTVSYTDGLARRLDQTPNLANYRLEVVPDGTHVAAYTLIAHAALARGYETQSDNQLNHVLMSNSIDAVSYRAWLDDNAVAYVALDRVTLQHNPEDRLVRSGTVPYLKQVWSDDHWLLYAVERPVPIAPPPARVTDADQADIVISVPRAGRYELHLRWSRFLRFTPNTKNAQLQEGANGHSVLVASTPGSYTIAG
jgi:hypothetical protein